VSRSTSPDSEAHNGVPRSRRGGDATAREQRGCDDGAHDGAQVVCK
jgi:hypothetical protein